MRPAVVRFVPVVAGILGLLAAAAPPAVVAADPVVINTWPTVDDDALATNDLHVTVSTPAEGAVTMKVSNDGLTWKSMPWAASTEWDLDDAAYGGSATPEFKTVWVWFDNGTDSWDPDWEVEDGIWYDVEPPVETGMRVSLYPGGAVSTIGRVPHRVTWLNGDNVGTKSYDVEDRLEGGGSWNPVASGAAVGVLASIAAAHVHQLRAHGVDYAGNVSDWLVGPSVGVTGVQEGSSRIDYSGGWKRVTGTTFWGGASKVTTTADHGRR